MFEKENGLFSFSEMLARLESMATQAEEEVAKATNQHMPAIILTKLKQEALFWNSVRIAVEEYMHWTEKEVLATAMEDPDDKVDMVNAPNHYAGEKKYEVIDVIHDWLTPEEFRGAIKFNAFKYLARERLKNGDEDILKTIFYLNYLMHGTKTDGSPRKG